MKALLLKDFLVLRKQFRVLALVFVMYGILGFFADNYIFLSAFIPFIFIMLVLTSVAFDDACKWTGYALALPISRNQLVLSKYLLTLLLGLIGAVTSCFYGYTMLFLLKQPLSPEIFISCFTSVSIGLTSFFLLLPVVFRFGSEKARYIMFLLFMIPFLFILIAGQSGLFDNLSLEPLKNLSSRTLLCYLLLGEAGIVILSFLISLPISIHIVEKKEY